MAILSNCFSKYYAYVLLSYHVTHLLQLDVPHLVHPLLLLCFFHKNIFLFIYLNPIWLHSNFKLNYISKSIHSIIISLLIAVLIIINILLNEKNILKVKKYLSLGGSSGLVTGVALANRAASAAAASSFLRLSSSSRSCSLLFISFNSNCNIHTHFHRIR